MDERFQKTIREKKRRGALRRVILGVAAAAAVISLILYQRGSIPRDARGSGAGEATIAISCEALIKSEGDTVDPAVMKSLPKDGVILEQRRYPIVPGETTVFELTDQICKDNDIQIEYSYTPGYGGYYIEGINYLYERAAGTYSGWRYSVNGEDPGVGCDKCTLTGGEEILWYYTING